ncbi:hypothetical protein BDB01DRAFT_798555 [Pilobolus umbonatus]|nr:hypothetical protein BDB01DRAFT_798555 [Pilobolus umbonatus]
MDTKEADYFNDIKSITAAINSILATTRITKENRQVISDRLCQLHTYLSSVNEIYLSASHAYYIITQLSRLFQVMVKDRLLDYDDIMEPALHVMYFVLANTSITLKLDLSVTKELLKMLNMFIDTSMKQYGVSIKSEEVRHLSIRCLSKLLPNERTTRPDIIHSIQQESSMPVISHTIYSLTTIIQKEHNNAMRLDALKLLSQILFIDLNSMETLALFLPGITSALSKTILMRLELENHQIICDILNILGQLISTVMADDMNTTLTEAVSFDTLLQPHTPSTDATVNRQKEWYQSTGKNIYTILVKLLEMRYWPDWKTRLAFVNFSYSLLSSCSRTLENCIKILVESMVFRIDDEYKEVSVDCRVKMQFLLTSPHFKSTIVPIMKTELYEWIMKLPHYIISKSEQEKSNVLSLIIGIILLLQGESETVLSSVLPRISDGWLNALQFDNDIINILEEKKSHQFLTFDDQPTSPRRIMYPKLRFKYLKNDDSMEKTTRLINVIGKYCDLSYWVHHFIRYFSNQSIDPQSIYITHSLLAGAITTDTLEDHMDWLGDKEIDIRHEEARLLAQQVLNQTINLMMEQQQKSILSKSVIDASRPLTDETAHILSICLELQLIGLACCILDGSYIQDQLITLLYPLLGQLGSPNVLIHEYALITLESVAVVCGSNSPQDLILDNIDYVINSVSQHLSVITDNIRAPLVLKALIHLGGSKAVKYLEDSVIEIFDALDKYHLDDWLCRQLCGVLYEIVETVFKGKEMTHSNNEYKEEHEQEPCEAVSKEIRMFIEEHDEFENDIKEEHRSMEEIGKYFLEQQQKGKHENLSLEDAMCLENERENKPAQDKMNEEDKQKMPLSNDENMTKSIMEKISHLLTAPSPQLKVQILKILTMGSSILSSHDTELNVLIHDTWPYIVNRLDDQENYIIFHTALLINRIAEVSKDFISDKFSIDIWPRFKALLERSSGRDPNMINYSTYSISHKTQHCILQLLTHVITFVPVKRSLVVDILNSTRQYYNSSTQPELQNTCRLLYNTLSKQEPDIVWLYTISLNNNLPHLMNPPSDLLNPVFIPDWIK